MIIPVVNPAKAPTTTPVGTMIKKAHIHHHCELSKQLVPCNSTDEHPNTPPLQSSNQLLLKITLLTSDLTTTFNFVSG